MLPGLWFAPLLLALEQAREALPGVGGRDPQCIFGIQGDQKKGDPGGPKLSLKKNTLHRENESRLEKQRSLPLEFPSACGAGRWFCHHRGLASATGCPSPWSVLGPGIVRRSRMQRPKRASPQAHWCGSWPRPRPGPSLGRRQRVAGEPLHRPQCALLVHQHLAPQHLQRGGRQDTAQRAGGRWSRPPTPTQEGVGGISQPNQTVRSGWGG